MARPIYRWNLAELTNSRTLHVADDGAELKVAGPGYRVWLVDGKKVRVDELQEKTWRVAEEYEAKPE